MFYPAHREEIAARNTAYNATHREQRRRIAAAYYAANRDAVRSQQRAYDSTAAGMLADMRGDAKRRGNR